MPAATILLVEDDPSLAGELRHVLESEGWRVVAAGTAEQGLMLADREQCDVVQLFAQAIKLAHGSQTTAARWLGISQITMREKLAQFGLNPRGA